MTFTSFTALLLTMLVLSVTPGPSDVAIVARSAGAGFRHGLLMIMGVVVADLLLILAAVFGMTALAQSAAPIFIAVKILGALWLIWLGIGSFRKSRKSAADSPEREATATFISSFMSGLLITLGDPKAILFYVGMLPAFVDLSGISVRDTVLIMLAATLVITVVKTLYAWLAHRASTWLQDEVWNRRLQMVSGSLLMLVGGYVLLSL